MRGFTVRRSWFGWSKGLVDWSDFLGIGLMCGQVYL